MRHVLIVSVGLVLAAPAAQADELESVPPISDPVVKRECGDCHMAFQPQFLPGSSWIEIMNTLDDHFGEDASLAPDLRDRVTDYLVRHAPRRGEKALRITKLRWWQREHDGEVSRREWKRAKSPANCAACHRDAELGYYDDD